MADVTLRGISKRFGQVLAIADIDLDLSQGDRLVLLGRSGAGKTTLMDVIAGRKTTGQIHGDMFINGFPKVRKE